jgi:hypothetical protein
LQLRALVARRVILDYLSLDCHCLERERHEAARTGA